MHSAASTWLVVWLAVVVGGCATRAAPVEPRRPSWAERQVRKLVGDDEWGVTATYESREKVRAQQCDTLPAREPEFRPAPDFLDQLEGQDLKDIGSRNLGGTGLAPLRFPAASAVDERFRMSSLGATEQPAWVAN